MLIGNKSDCNNRVVSYEEGFELGNYLFTYFTLPF